jgi:rhamnogalacturonan endolyase
VKFAKLLTGILLFWLPAALFAAPMSSVIISEDDSAYTLDNGIVTARAAKRSGDLISLKYKGLELLSTQSGRWGGYWSHNTANGQHVAGITLDPKTNGGRRGEVSLKGIYSGNPMGSGPGGSVAADIDIRYALGRGDSGL